MLGLGLPELLVIGVVALVVIGPKELPAVMKRVGQFAGQLRRMGNEFQRELNKTTGLNEIRNLRDSVTQPLKATADAIRKEFNTTTPTGEVKPSGAITPADPKAESVVDEIRAKAGLPPAPATDTDPASADKLAEGRQVMPLTDKPVYRADLPAAPAAGIESPAPVEAVAKPAPAVQAAPPVASPTAKTSTAKTSTAKTPAATTPVAGTSATKAPGAKAAAKPRAVKATAAPTPSESTTAIDAGSAGEVPAADKPARKPRVTKPATDPEGTAVAAPTPRRRTTRKAE